MLTGMKAILVLTLVLVWVALTAACSSGVASIAVSETAGDPPLPILSPKPAPTAEPRLRLSDAGPAPEIANETWINSDEPLTLASQRGKVVLLEFWTFGCINCQRVIPIMRQWHSDFAGDDFQVISIHYPEFAHEREFDNVVAATERFKITYPVALDNDGRTWRDYNQRYWPTTYLIDKEGHIRYKHIGEFNETSAAAAEDAIETLLAE
jgi:thiol-disulfide isomerase/thioredoxin